MLGMVKCASRAISFPGCGKRLCYDSPRGCGRHLRYGLPPSCRKHHPAVSPGVQRAPPLEGGVRRPQPTNQPTSGNSPVLIFRISVSSRRWKDVSTRCCDPRFRSPNELLKTTFSGALAMLWKTSCFRRWAFIMWVSCASVGIYR